MTDSLLYKIEAEQVVIGTLLLDNSLLDEVISELKVTDFYTESLRNIYKIIVALYKENKPFDLLTVAEKGQALKLDFDSQSLAHLAENSISFSNFNSYVEIVKKYGKRRDLLLFADHISKMCMESSDLDSIVARIEDDLGKLTLEELSQASTLTAKETLTSTIQMLDDITQGKIQSLPTAWNNYNEITGGGLHLGELTVVAGRPSMGKTTFALIMLLSIIMSKKNHFNPGLIFTLEMSKEELMFKVLSFLTRIDYSNIRTGDISAAQANQIQKATGIISQLPLFFNDRGGITIQEIKSICKRYKRQQNLKVVAIDYLQLISTKKKYTAEQRVLEISHITRELKILAKDLNIAIILLSQLNRQVDSRANKKPLLSDLRDSGAIEQDADNVIFLYRPEIYSSNDKNITEKGKAEVIIAKQRLGEVGTLNFIFEGQYSSFKEPGSRD